MARLLFGERIGREGSLRLGCSAVIFDETRERVLLLKRTDNKLWCLPSGGMEPGETVTEACIRETLEETGLHIRVLRLIGVYSSPNVLLEYPDGRRNHVVGLAFEAEVTGGSLRVNEEASDFGYYSLEDLKTLFLMEHHRERLEDAFRNASEVFVR